MKITKDSIKAFRSEFAVLVTDLERKHGIKIEIGTIRFSGNEFTGKLTVKNLGENGVVENTDFPLYASLLGVPATWQNKEFVTREGKTLRIVGLNPRRPKNAVELEDVNTGNKYKSSIDYIKRSMKD